MPEPAIVRFPNASRWFPVVLAVLGFAVISPALWSGWLGDDAFFSALNGVLKADDITLGEAMLRAFQAWFFGNGRFTPIHILINYLVFHFLTNLIAYKAFLIAMTLVTVELFRRCVAAYTEPAIANLCALIVVTLFAERGYHDSILAYNGMPQFVAIAMLASLMLFRHALHDRSRPALLSSATLFAVAALTYEAAYPLCLLYFAIAQFSRKNMREALKIAAPYLVIVALLSAFALVMRHMVKLSPGSQYAFNLNPPLVMRTAAEQISAALPLSYWIFNPSGIYSHVDVADFFRNTPLNPAVFIAFALVAWWVLSAARRESSRLSPLIWVGVLTLVLPALPIALTAKYQQELKFGLGYLPVFFEVFGIAAIGGAFAVFLMRRFPRRATPIVLCVLVAACATITQAANVRLVRENAVPRAARSALEHQLAGGLLSGAHDGAKIAMARNFDWVAYDRNGPDGIATFGLFSQYADRRVELVPLDDSSADLVLTYDRARNVWIVAKRASSSS
ncbi:MAG: hypothetical protein JOY69_05805, partial [Candidatus Eremiobacteraeota bacterium]|nr:hypothetical protein [Candidatus Eremiobacteraeota bacterium]